MAGQDTCPDANAGPPGDESSEEHYDEISAPEEEPIEGGEVVDLAEEKEWQERKYHAETASRLAWGVFWLLAVSGAIHYVATAYFSQADNPEAVQALSDFFGTWLPVISGFFGAAVTYYFTRGRR